MYVHVIDKALMDGPSVCQTGFMEGHQANGAFVACGPPGFTALALINLGSQARKMSLVAPFLHPHFPSGCADSLFSLLSISAAVR
jgi:hypothetical protein